MTMPDTATLRCSEPDRGYLATELHIILRRAALRLRKAAARHAAPNQAVHDALPSGGAKV
ncbi:hypothetical protein AMK06_CH00561 [Rhizobium sp. N541]|uniref:hypothetical protein n=1 Tax=Rhizobium sp. N4311 TaxID=1703972 RepID=UPI0007F161B7|nr:hypothetical protein [Rhizobium sp. N4311]ANM08981.1 hypothetical protein AMK05_CH00546 [Rhizobium sp. N324]ANM15506.1 hypothetical protein AMK06_CH00561 [Rhizobium sp. N541]ANM21894.1 hypothetical protein AMK07_CH00561 [Rhizobium sp. N941]OYD02550.1 hypothetical protein AMK08_CH100543 [Rhizobium sp. N4311]